MTWIFLLLLSVPAMADTPAPFYPRVTTQNTDMGGINQDFLNITNRNRDNLVPIVGDQACSPGQALLGATEKGGYIFGGTCSTVQTSSMTNVSRSSSTSSFSTGSTSYLVLSGSSSTVIVVNATSKIKISWILNEYNTTADAHDFVDVRLDGASTGAGCYQRESGGSHQRTCSGVVLTGAVGAGTHTASLFIKTDAGTFTLDPMFNVQVIAEEVP